MLLSKAYYTFKFLIPRRLQIQLRRYLIKRKLLKYADIWPIDKNAAKPPEGWTGWPEGKDFALVLTHDVESVEGLDRCYQLAEIEARLGFRSSYNFVPGDYEVPAALHQYLKNNAFEIGVHGLHHKNNPFRSKSTFQKQSIEINRYLKEWDSVGFRSPSMYHDLDLLHHLDIEYDASTFDTDPFEPQPDGMGTIFPFWVSNRDNQKGYAELPYTLPQDFLLFILLREKNIDIWKKKLNWIVDHGGMALFITHPNYINFDGYLRHDEYPTNYYEEFLEYIKVKYEGRYWHALPREVSRFWAEKSKSAGSCSHSPRSLPSESIKSTTCERSSASNVIMIDPISDPRWDQFVENHPLGLICHLSPWKQVLEESFSHMKGHYLTLLNQDNSIRAALPVFEIKSIFTGNRLVSIPFATNCDPLISSNEDMSALLDTAIDLSIKLGCPKIEIRTLSSWPLIQDDRIGIMVHNKSHQLSLESTPEELINTFSRKARWTINQSLKKGFEHQLAESERDLNEFYHLYVKTRKRLGLPPQPYLFFQLLWEKFSPSRRISLLLVRYKGKLIAGLLMFKFKDRCSWDYLASDANFQNLNTNYFGVWEAIKLAHSEGYKIFDFGRTGINNEGLMSFKGRWGTKVMDLPQFYYPKRLCSSLSPPEESQTYNFIRQISKKTPDSMFRLMGSFLYRHLG
jgi:peptidoglycan/xylan/chitin deacetylase (PgdA/CDA1 family)